MVIKLQQSSRSRQNVYVCQLLHHCKLLITLQQHRKAKTCIAECINTALESFSWLCFFRPVFGGTLPPIVHHYPTLQLCAHIWILPALYLKPDVQPFSTLKINSCFHRFRILHIKAKNNDNKTSVMNLTNTNINLPAASWRTESVFALHQAQPTVLDRCTCLVISVPAFLQTHASDHFTYKTYTKFCRCPISRCKSIVTNMNKE